MKYSDNALKIWAAKEKGIIKSNAQFWTGFYSLKEMERFDFGDILPSEIVGHFMQQYTDGDEGVICVFDDEFPCINPKVKNSDKPYLLFYKGDISLLQNLNKNIAVIGHTDPTDDVKNREIEALKQLVDENVVIVSGLAKGCDAIAHQFCVNTQNKTIAILPTQINKIYPASNRSLAKGIVSNGGLLLSEYYKEPEKKQEALGRYVERDRLQAMFSKAVVLIASYRKNDGDSGSRHAMEAAKNYGHARFALYNEKSDCDDLQFGLNKDYLAESVKILQKSTIDVIRALVNPNLIKQPYIEPPTQLTLM